MMDNKAKNKDHYEKKYSNFSVHNILWILNNIETFLNDATTTDTSWFALYQGNFRNILKGSKVLEMGCGDCTNAAVMAALGAEVYANDIASTSNEIIKQLNTSFNFQHPIVFLEGDLLYNNFPPNNFDFIVGKAFLHHLTVSEERKILRETARLLKPNGEARFFEPAVNNKVLDALRWYIPVPGRPSKLQSNKYMKWKESDPHPDRDFSSSHWEAAGREFFDQVEITPLGTIERFSRLITLKEFKTHFRRWAFKVEKVIPRAINKSLARSQLIKYTRPTNS